MYTHLVVHLGLVVFAARAEAGAGSPLLAVPGDVTRVAAGGAHDAVGDVGLVLALPRLVVGGPAVGAPGALALAQGAVEQRQFAQLGTPAGRRNGVKIGAFDRRKLNPQYAFSPKVILSLRYVDSCRDHFLDLFYGLLHRVEVVGGDVRVQWLVLAGQGLPVLPRHL